MCFFLAFLIAKRGPQPVSAKPQAPTRLPPQGKKDGNHRTAKHIADPAGGKDMYNVQNIIAERWHHGQFQYMVHWQGYSEADDTWEPLAHLSDALEYVARWNEDKKKRDAEAELQRQEKKQKAQEGSSSSNAEAPQTPQYGPQQKQTSIVWKAFREATPEEGGKYFAICQVKKLDGALCGQAIRRSGGTSNIWSHLNASHGDWVVQSKANKVPTQHTLQATGDRVLEVQHTAIKWTKHKWHKACRRLAWCIIQTKRPAALVNDQISALRSPLGSSSLAACIRSPSISWKCVPSVCMRLEDVLLYW